MKFARFVHEDIERTGIVESGQIKEINGSFFDNYTLTGETFALDQVRLLVPIKPSKVVAIGMNYVDHIRELGSRGIPKNPIIFVKLPHTIIGPEDSIIIPEDATRVDYEAEMAVVIKKSCKNVGVREAADYIFGVTCLNDVTERDVQKVDGQWMRAKNYETFCPIGPWIVTGLQYGKLDIKSLLNGELKQSSNTLNLLWSVEELVSFVSKVIPLEQGDIITTGTPFGIGPMKAGDVIEVVIEGIGTLRNTVRAK